MTTVTPAVLMHRHLDTVIGHLPGVFDGEGESVHQARIATRRVREVLPLIREGLAPAVAEAVRAAGRHLGRVRELDVTSALLESAALRVVSVATAAATARLRVCERQRLQRRAMVKAIERLELERLRDGCSRHEPWLAGLRQRPRTLRTPDWVEPLWTRIVDRGSDAADAVRHATGVYFPQRAHKARIAVKKLRYAVEVAADTGLWRSDQLLKDLRRVQGTLGSMHDRQVLVDMLDDLAPEQAGTPGMVLLKGLVEDQIAQAHEDYLRRRERIFAIADACTRASRARSRWGASTPLVAASAIAAPLLLLGRRRSA